MKHWYKKKPEILFEQFDGSNEMIDKYGLSLLSHLTVNSQIHFILKIK